MPELSRRSLVRASAGALWVAPVITVATTAPALAVSGEGTVTIDSDFTKAGYAKALGFAPDEIALNIGLQNTGSAPLYMVYVTLFLQEEFGAAESLNHANVDAVDTGNGWMLTYPPLTLPGNARHEILDVIKLTSTTDHPFLGYRGQGGTFTVVVIKDELEHSAESIQVAPLGYKVKWENATASVTPLADGTLQLSASDLAASRAGDIRGIGRVSFGFTMPKMLDGVELTEAPPITGISPAGTWEHRDTLDGIDSWIYRFRSVEHGFAGMMPGTDPTKRGPNSFQAQIHTGLAGHNLDGITYQWIFTAEGLQDFMVPDGGTGSA